MASAVLIAADAVAGVTNVISGMVSTCKNPAKQETLKGGNDSCQSKSAADVVQRAQRFPFSAKNCATPSSSTNCSALKARWSRCAVRKHTTNANMSPS